MVEFSLHNRKNFPYIPRNELHPASNRKISANFTFACYPIKDKTSYLKGMNFITKIQENLILMPPVKTLIKIFIRKFECQDTSFNKVNVNGLKKAFKLENSQQVS